MSAACSPDVQTLLLVLESVIVLLIGISSFLTCRILSSTVRNILIRISPERGGNHLDDRRNEIVHWHTVFEYGRDESTGRPANREELRTMSANIDRENKIEITPEMIEAGFKVFCSSGIADEYLKADKVVVAEIFEAMWECRPRSRWQV